MTTSLLTCWLCGCNAFSIQAAKALIRLHTHLSLGWSHMQRVSKSNVLIYVEILPSRFSVSQVNTFSTKLPFRVTHIILFKIYCKGSIGSFTHKLNKKGCCFH